jgi:hypothetical protein
MRFSGDPLFTFLVFWSVERIAIPFSMLLYYVVVKMLKGGYPLENFFPCMNTLNPSELIIIVSGKF